LSAAVTDIKQFIVDAFRAFTGSRGAFVGLLFAVLPAGAYALGLALNQISRSNSVCLTPRLESSACGSTSSTPLVASSADGFRIDSVVAECWRSSSPRDNAADVLHGRRDGPFPLGDAGRHRCSEPATGSPDLVTIFWIACLVYAVFQGLMYGTRTALFMDITTPAVAATQFTAYMALLNFGIQYSARWQGLALERWGYPTTLMIDGTIGLISLTLLPLVAPKRQAVGSMALGPSAVPESVNM
jgi:PAT family beta-lactamase induction signal transducer AmpG